MFRQRQRRNVPPSSGSLWHVWKQKILTKQIFYIFIFLFRNSLASNSKGSDRITGSGQVWLLLSVSEFFLSDTESGRRKVLLSLDKFSRGTCGYGMHWLTLLNAILWLKCLYFILILVISRSLYFIIQGVSKKVWQTCQWRMAVIESRQWGYSESESANEQRPESSQTHLEFERNSFSEGILWMTCANESTKNWKKSVGNFVMIWSEAKDVPSISRVLVFIPGQIEDVGQ